jgi:hypothetical protein
MSFSLVQSLFEKTDTAQRWRAESTPCTNEVRRPVGPASVARRLHHLDHAFPALAKNTSRRPSIRPLR